MENRVLIDIQDHVAHVRLNRPDKMNALDDAMFEAIVDAGEQLKANPDIRAVVLSGEGRAFCAGLDMGNFANMASGKPMTRQRSQRPRTMPWAGSSVAPMAWRIAPSTPAGSGVSYRCL